jgi:uncharacterized membrane protein
MREVVGTNLGRVVAFTDGVFAIAITLLVLNIDAPEVADENLRDEIVDLWPSLLAYFLSFAVVGRFWIVHHRVFDTVKSFDGRLLALNLIFLSFVVLVPFTTEILGEYGNTRAGVVTYAGVIGLAALVNWLMTRYIVTAGHVREEHRPITEVFAGRTGLINPAVFLVSIPIALISPYVAIGMWVALSLAWPVQRRRAGRRAAGPSDRSG